jgi:hypothetical protein
MRGAEDQTARIIMHALLSSKEAYEDQLRRAREVGFAAKTKHVPYDCASSLVGAPHSDFSVRLAT